MKKVDGVLGRFLRSDETAERTIEAMRPIFERRFLLPEKLSREDVLSLCLQEAGVPGFCRLKGRPPLIKLVLGLRERDLRGLHNGDRKVVGLCNRVAFEEMDRIMGLGGRDAVPAALRLLAKEDIRGNPNPWYVAETSLRRQHAEALARLYKRRDRVLAQYFPNGHSGLPDLFADHRIRNGNTANFNDRKRDSDLSRLVPALRSFVSSYLQSKSEAVHH